mgnify:CR=1 FL=1
MGVVKQVRHKAGDTLSWPCVRTDDAGDPVPLGNTSVDACFGTLGALGVTITDAAAGEFVITATNPVTVTWQTGNYRGDVTFTGPAGVESTKTYILIVERGLAC